MKLRDVLNTMMRNNAVLHLRLAEKPTWELHNGTAETTIRARTVRAALKRRAIVAPATACSPTHPRKSAGDRQLRGQP